MMLFWLKSKRASTHGTTNDQTTAIELVVVSFLSLYFAECNFFARFFFFFFFSFFKKNPQRMLIGIRNVALLISSTLCVLCLCHSIQHQQAQKFKLSWFVSSFPPSHHHPENALVI
jgi:hypothetical protein